jgi:hypothetical protein
MFDPETFMSQIIDQPLETEFLMVPQGEYTATIDDFTSEAFEQIHFEYKKGPRAGTPGVMTKFTLPFVIQDDAVKTELGRDKLVVYKQLILDVGDDGGLDWGKNKNIDLGRIRAAVGQNDPGPWSIGNLRGAGPVMVKVVHVPFERKDKSRGERVEIERVVRIA